MINGRLEHLEPQVLLLYECARFQRWKVIPTLGPSLFGRISRYNWTKWEEGLPKKLTCFITLMYWECMMAGQCQSCLFHQWRSGYITSLSISSFSWRVVDPPAGRGPGKAGRGGGPCESNSATRLSRASPFFSFQQPPPPSHPWFHFPSIPPSFLSFLSSLTT